MIVAREDPGRLVATHAPDPKLEPKRSPNAVALIEIRGLTKLYRMGTSVVRALDGVDLDIRRGEFVAISGPSGSGKSTVMHLLGCLDRPTSGRYSFDGRNVSDLSDGQLAEIRNRQIGFVFQTFNLMNRTTAVENVAVPLFYARRTHTLAPARAALERVGLSQRATHRSNELSGGERQRVAIARAIVNDPLLVLADEPTGNLDSRTGQQIIDVFRALNEQGVTIVLVTHEYDVAIQARRIVEMRDGQIVSDRPTEEVLKEDGGPAHHRMRSPAALVPTPGEVRDAASGVARAATAPGDTLDAAALGPPKLAPGANGALVVGLVAGLLVVAATALAESARSSGFNPADVPPDQILARMPRGLLVKSMVSLVATVAGFVLGIVAVLLARRARKRMYEQPGNWRGAARLRLAAVLGWLVIVGPILLSLGRWLLRPAD